MTRREWVRACARGAFAAGLFALGAGWLLRSRTARNPAAGPGQECDRGGVCRGCPAYADCGLPAARSAKRARHEAGG
jgi:hypothetical protein